MSRNMSLELKVDGVYLTITRQYAEQTIDAKDILNYLNEFEVKDILIPAVEILTTSKGLVLTEKISENVNVKKVDEQTFITMSEDKMEAYIMFKPPFNGGNVLNIEQLEQRLDDAGVRYGILDDVKRNIILSKKYDFEYLIAKGNDKVDGTDGYINYNFETGVRELKPKKMEDGSVDYQDMGFIQIANKDDILAEIVDPIEGEDGHDVTGKAFPHKKGKVISTIPKGKNVEMSSAGNRLIATIDGQIEFTNNKTSINPIVTINRVDNSTGNIDFNGSVIIKQGVASGFSVKATGNIEISGAVESSIIESSGGSIILYGGVMGRDKAKIIAKENVVAKFIDSAVVIAGNDISSNSIMHADITCDRSLVLSGKNGLLVGGKICVGKSIEAVTIGAPMATATVLEVGNTPAKIANFKNLESQLESVNEKIKKTEQIIKVLKSIKGDLPEDKKKMLLKSFHTKIFLNTEKTKLEKEIAIILPTLESNKGKVAASKIIYPGVKVLVGNAMLKVKDELSCCVLKNVDGKVVIGPY